tara:strand:+ start:1487 stop:2125 length:639 start_codon:yes stop_codon:yes gene_type:complete
MSLALKKIKKIKSMDSVENQNPNNAKIYTEETSVYFDVNGNIFSLEIVYKGIIRLQSSLGVQFRVNYSDNKITIINLLNQPLPNKLFDYYGDMQILDCRVLTYSGVFFKATINNDNRDVSVQNQKTNVEDDTLTIYDEPKEGLYRPFKKGKGTIDLSNINRERLDANQILTMIPKVLEKRKRTTREKTIRIRPSVRKPAVKKKTPTIKGGKY